MKEFTLTIQENSNLPKYQQLINSILYNIKTGKLKVGDKLPSIINSSIEYDLSKDTIGRAYKELYSIGIIKSISRKGFFVSNDTLGRKAKRALFITGKPTTQNQTLFNRLSNSLGHYGFKTDLMLNYNDPKKLRNILDEEIANFQLFFIETQMLDKQNVISVFTERHIQEKDFVVFNDDSNFASKNTTLISYNSSYEIFNSLQRLNKELRRYEMLNLVLPDKEYFSFEIIKGFFQYCDNANLKGRIVEELNEANNKEAYFLIDEESFFVLSRLLQNDPETDVGVFTLFEKEYLNLISNKVTSIDCFSKRSIDSIVNNIFEKSTFNLSISPEVLERRVLN